MNQKNPLLSLLKSVGKVIGIGAICATLLLVLLPLGWMTITAFKARGTAFRLQFIPPTTVVLPSPDDPAITIPPADQGVFAFGFDGPATEVVVTIQNEAGSLEITRLNFIPPNQWLGVSGKLPSGVYTVSIEVGGGDQTAGWATAIGREVDEVGFLRVVHDGSTPTILSNGITFLLAAAQADDSERRRSLVYRNAPGESYDVLFDDGTTVRRVDLREATITIPAAAQTFRLVEHRSFATAFATFYTLNNFRIILTSDDFNFGRFFINSLIVAFGAALLTVFLCSTAAFAFATKEFHFRDTLFRLLLASMLIPGMIYLVPQFSIVVKLQWLNTYQGMIVPHIANVFGLFLMRQYMLQIPKDLFAAAEIDGASDLQVFARIVIPVCVPIIITLFILVFVGQWSNFLWQLIVNSGDVSMMTLPVGLQQFRGQNSTEWELIMAGACFSLIPITVLFLLLQKYFMSGLTAGAVKE